MIPEHIGRTLQILVTAYPTWGMTAATPELWAMLLADVTPQALLDAAVHHVRTSRFPPTIAELREIAAKTDEAELAGPDAMFLRVQAAVAAATGDYPPRQVKTIVWPEAAVGAAFEEVGGWKTFCVLEVSEVPFLRNRFRDALIRQRTRFKQMHERDATAAIVEGESFAQLAPPPPRNGVSGIRDVLNSASSSPTAISSIISGL